MTPDEWMRDRRRHDMDRQREIINAARIEPTQHYRADCIRDHIRDGSDRDALSHQRNQVVNLAAGLGKATVVSGIDAMTGHRVKLPNARVKDGKLEIDKPKAKLPPNVQYAKANKRKWKAAK